MNINDKDFARLINDIEDKTFTPAQFKLLMTACAGVQRKQAQIAKCTLRPEQKVKFLGRGGVERTGTLVRTMSKNAEVKINGQRWRVPMSLLQKG